jgi:hypothetical protein
MIGTSTEEISVLASAAPPAVRPPRGQPIRDKGRPAKAADDPERIGQRIRSGGASPQRRSNKVWQRPDPTIGKAIGMPGGGPDADQSARHLPSGSCRVMALSCRIRDVGPSVAIGGKADPDETTLDKLNL